MERILDDLSGFFYENVAIENEIYESIDNALFVNHHIQSITYDRTWITEPFETYLIKGKKK